MSEGSRELLEELRRGGLSDPAVLAALGSVPREQFLPPETARFAHQNRALAIGWGQTCSQPQIIGMTLAALMGLRLDSVLEVGAGSGYLAAVLRAAGATRVTALELVPELAAICRRNLNRAMVSGVEVRVGDGRSGAPDLAPFDAVVISAAAPEVPAALLQQVRVGGRLVAPLGTPEEQHIWVLGRSEAGFERRDLGPCRFVPLLGSDTAGRGSDARLS
ncbi:MAG TPA: methyltransferase domain-containing protein [Candidatus Nanopelagicaceae bacterium]|nr:methyltransferase domain-containing protein [Candidatus Nanopelagicaceae bacterium]